jgi:hypothetical protein
MQTAGARILPDYVPQGTSQDDPRRTTRDGLPELPGGGPHGMSREAVLLEWERKIEAAERRTTPLERPGEVVQEAEPRPRRSERPGDERDVATRGPSRFERSRDERRHSTQGVRRSRGAGPLVEDVPHAAPRRHRRQSGSAASATERRTITITGRPGPPRRRRSVVDNQLAQPDRIALWAFLLGLFLVAVAAGTAHA